MYVRLYIMHAYICVYVCMIVYYVCLSLHIHEEQVYSWFSTHLVFKLSNKEIIIKFHCIYILFDYVGRHINIQCRSFIIKKPFTHTFTYIYTCVCVYVHMYLYIHVHIRTLDHGFFNNDHIFSFAIRTKSEISIKITTHRLYLNNLFKAVWVITFEPFRKS